MSEGGRGDVTVIAPVAGCIRWYRVRFCSSSATRSLATALGVVCREILVGISCRTVGVVELLFLTCHTSNCDAVDSGGVREWLEMVSRMD